MRRIHFAVIAAAASALAIGLSLSYAASAAPPSAAPQPSMQRKAPVVAPQQPAALPCHVTLMGEISTAPACTSNPLAETTGGQNAASTITFAFQPATNGTTATAKLGFHGAPFPATSHEADLTFDVELTDGVKKWKGHRATGEVPVLGALLRFTTTTPAAGGTIVHGYAIVPLFPVPGTAPDGGGAAAPIHFRIDF